MLNFLTDRRQQEWLGSITFSTRIISTGDSQECVLPTAHHPLYYDCTSGDLSVKILKFADDTTVAGLIQVTSDKSAYRQEAEQLALWCGQNNLELNTLKTVEMMLDFRRKNHRCRPALHSGHIHLQSQVTWRKHHCRSITPWTQHVRTSPLWVALQSTVCQNN